MIRIFFFLLLVLLSKVGLTEDTFEIIHDAEIESYIYKVATPLLLSGGLNPDSVRFFVLRDRSINAFVSGGENITVNTGLLLFARNTNVLEGVLSHEIGHIASGHIVKQGNEMSDAVVKAAIGVLSAGVLVAAASRYGGSGQNIGTADVASGIVLGGQQYATRTILSSIRTQEKEADRYAVKILNDTGRSSAGILELFKQLEQMQRKLVLSVDRYSITHPLTPERIEYIKDNTSNFNYTEQFEHEHRMILAKLNGYFLTKMDIVLNDSYKDYEDSSLYYEIYRALAKQNFDQCIQLSKKLLVLEPNNPYVHEVIAQCYLSKQNTTEAISHYSFALKETNNVMILQELINAYINDGSSLVKAIDIINSNYSIIKYRDDLVRIKEQLAIIYGKMNNIAMFHLTMAEKFLLLSDLSKAQNSIESFKKLPMQTEALNARAALLEKDIKASLLVREND